MAQSAFKFLSNADQLEVQAYCMTPDQAPIASVQIAHGLAEHAARYTRLAKHLNGLGFIVYANDHRGHGHSIPDGGKLGSVGEAGWGGLVSDVVQLSETIAEKHADIPNFIFGHSLGSFAVQQFLLDHSASVDGAILSGSTDIAMVAQMVAATGEAPSFDAYNAAFAPNRTDFDWLSRDEAEVDAYVADPMCGMDVDEALTGGLMEVAGQFGDPARLGRIRSDLPLLVLAGDADPLNGALALLHSLIGKYQTAGMTNVATKFYTGGRHEMLNETNRDEVESDISAWLKGLV